MLNAYILCLTNNSKVFNLDVFVRDLRSPFDVYKFPKSVTFLRISKGISTYNYNDPTVS